MYVALGAKIDDRHGHIFSGETAVLVWLVCVCRQAAGSCLWPLFRVSWTIVVFASAILAPLLHQPYPNNFVESGALVALLLVVIEPLISCWVDAGLARCSLEGGAVSARAQSRPPRWKQHL